MKSSVFLAILLEVVCFMGCSSYHIFRKSTTTLNITQVKSVTDSIKFEWIIKNTSKQDIWICEDIIAFYEGDLEVLVREEEQTLLIRRRLNVPTTIYFDEIPIGRYVLISSGETLEEEISLHLPIKSSPVLESINLSDTPKLVTLKKVRLEIGFFNEPLRNLVDKEIAKVLNNPIEETGDYTEDENSLMERDNALALEVVNRNSDKNVVFIPLVWSALDKEQMLATEIEGLKYQRTAI